MDPPILIAKLFELNKLTREQAQMLIGRAQIVSSTNAREGRHDLRLHERDKHHFNHDSSYYLEASSEDRKKMMSLSRALREKDAEIRKLEAEIEEALGAVAL